MRKNKNPLISTGFYAFYYNQFILEDYSGLALNKEFF
jgi:hypothetical protein